jgi:hypothetical protein
VSNVDITRAVEVLVRWRAASDTGLSRSDPASCTMNVKREIKGRSKVGIEDRQRRASRWQSDMSSQLLSVYDCSC